MEARDLVRNIKSDFISEVIPFMRSYPANATQLSQFYDQFRALDSLLSSQTYRTCSKIVLRNGFEFLYVGYFGSPAEFEKLVYLRFGSSTLASSLTSLLFKRKLGAWALIIRPAIDGAFNVAALILRNPQQAKHTCQTRFPGLTKFVLQDCGGQVALNFLATVDDLIREQRTDRLPPHA
jgi:hypothetical protein